MYLLWTEHDGREAEAWFVTEAEARRCAEGLRAREVQDLQLIEHDEPLPYP